jgi:hypothetical protein
MRISFFKICLFVVLIGLTFPATAQTSGTGNGFNMAGTPQWALDLRRAEIVAFGSFPFTFFFTFFAMDTIRMANNNWDARYAPWPFKAAGAIDMTPNEQLLTIGIAIGTSLLIAIIDYIIVIVQRNKRNQQIQSVPTGTPFIIRRPVEDSDPPLPEAESEEIDAP